MIRIMHVLRTDNNYIAKDNFPLAMFETDNEDILSPPFSICPIFSVSSVTGRNLELLMKFLNILPPLHSSKERERNIQQLTEHQVEPLTNTSYRSFNSEVSAFSSLTLTEVVIEYCAKLYDQKDLSRHKQVHWRNSWMFFDQSFCSSTLVLELHLISWMLSVWFS